jgi:hypothetical protein
MLFTSRAKGEYAPVEADEVAGRGRTELGSTASSSSMRECIRRAWALHFLLAFILGFLVAVLLVPLLHTWLGNGSYEHEFATEIGMSSFTMNGFQN